MPILTAAISANENDGHEWSGTWFIDGDSPPNMFAGSYGGLAIWLATRFQVNLASTVTVNSATLRLYAIGDQTGTPLLITRGDDVDNSAVPSGSAFPSARTFTTASTTKNLTAAEWGSAGWVTLDVTGIVSEILTRPGWSANNYMSLITTANTGNGGGDYVGFQDYSAAGTNHAELVIDYTAAGVPNATPADTSSGGFTEPPTITVPGVAQPADTSSGGFTEPPTISVPETGATEQISATADDGCHNGAASGFSAAATWMGAADYGNTTTFWVFRGLNIPQGAQLNSALLDYYLSYQFNRPDMTFYAVDADDIGTIDGGNLLTQTLTSASTLHSYSGRPAGGNSVNAWASATANVGAVNMLAAIQEVIDRPGWVSGNDVAIIAQKTGGDGYAFAITNDYTDGSANAARLIWTLNTNPQVSSCTSPRPGATFTASGFYLSGTTGATLTHVASGTAVAQTVGAVTDTSVTLTCVEGDLPPGALLLTLTGGATNATYTVTKLPALATSDWVEMVAPYTDTSSVGYGMSPALATGDRVEWKDAATITLTNNGVWGGGTIECRRWIEATAEWDAEGWITHMVVFGSAAVPFDTSSGGFTEPPTITAASVIAPADTASGGFSEPPTVFGPGVAIAPSDTSSGGFSEEPGVYGANTATPDDTSSGGFAEPPLISGAPAVVLPVARTVSWYGTRTPDFVIGDVFRQVITLNAGEPASPFDLSSATAIRCAVIDKGHTARLTDVVTLSSGDANASWANGRVVIEMSSAVTAQVADWINEQSFAKVEIDATIEGNHYTWFGVINILPGLIS